MHTECISTLAGGFSNIHNEKVWQDTVVLALYSGNTWFES
jgi:hypothetical protein